VTAGYSGTPQCKKLGIRPGLRVGLHNAPEGWALTDPPEYEPTPHGPADVLLAFVHAAAELGPLVPELGERIFPNGAAWIAWPRRAGGHTSDITDNIVRAEVLPHGLVDVKIAAIDEDWSGMKIVWRVENRH
jgi:hypothetical protein